jgi:dipeptidyl aminopeptidase/acylaminoacyl peptidase
MGDPGTPEGQALLKERSPLTYADAIKKPLLIGQGANDPRVNVAESDQIVAAMKAKNIPVTYVVFPDEGHGFARPVNNIAFNAVAENFLAKCLGGRAEPVGGALAASTAQIKAGVVEGISTAGATTTGN